MDLSVRAAVMNLTSLSACPLCRKKLSFLASTVAWVYRHGERTLAVSECCGKAFWLSGHEVSVTPK